MLVYRSTFQSEDTAGNWPGLLALPASFRNLAREISQSGEGNVKINAGKVPHVLGQDVLPEWDEQSCNVMG